MQKSLSNQNKSDQSSTKSLTESSDSEEYGDKIIGQVTDRYEFFAQMREKNRKKNGKREFGKLIQKV